MTEKEKRARQLEELKSGIFPGMYVVEQLNDSFQPKQRWQYESKKEAKWKFEELIQSGVAPAFLESYVKLSY